MGTPLRCPPGMPAVWDEPAPALELPKLDRYHITPGDPHELVIVNSRLTSLFTHYVDKRTQKCTSRTGGCFFDHATYGHGRWSGWLSVCLRNSTRIWLCGVTKVTVRHEPRLEDRLLSLRGMTLLLQRQGNGERTRLVGRLDPTIARPAILPREVDVRLAVERMIDAPDRSHRAEANQLLKDKIADEVRARETQRFLRNLDPKDREQLEHGTTAEGEVQP